MSTKKSLAKVFGPVLLLTAALALPVETMAAPPHAKHAAADKANKNEKNEKKNNKAKAQARGQQKSRAAQGRQQAELKHQRNAQRQAARQQQVQQQRIESQRQAKLQQQRVESQRQQRLVNQRQLELQRQAELRRQAQIRQQNAYRNSTRYRNNSRYQPSRRGGGGGADPNIFHIDGYLSGGSGNCQALRDHDGRVWMLVGNTYGLRQGDHVRLYGRIVDGGQCGWQGTAFDIYEVRTVWADDRHRSTYYDHLYDGAFNRDSYNYNDDRYEDGYYDGGYDDGYRDDGYYDDGYIPYNNSENRRLMIKEGRLDFSRGCTFLRSGNTVYGLSGDLRGYREGDNVRVTGWQEGRSRCGAPGLQVREITRD